MVNGANAGEERNVSVSDRVPADAVQAQLEKILGSSAFITSERHSRLLRHLVSMSLAGRSGEIKEYALGVDLFSRGPSFDPQTDAIVRTEVSRLRAKLKAYYSGDGREDPVLIELPVRSYVTVFKSRATTVVEVPPPLRTGHPKWLWIATALLVIAALVLYGSYWIGRASAVGLPPRDSDDELTSVAVLPFVNSDSDPEMEQFTDGLTEEVIETLAEIEGLRVVSRSSAFQFKGKQVDLKTVAAKLNVAAVLEGAVHRSGKQLRITARLINASEGYQYYSHVYEHDMKDAFTVQREIASQVASVLQVRQKGKEVARFTKSSEAHREYLQGLSHASRVSESELRQATDYYQRAIADDPNYSPAYTGLADAYVMLALLNEAPPRETMQRATAAARAAVKTGNTFPHAHAALGSVLALYEWDWAGAEKEFDKAIAGDPDDSSILQQYSMRDLVPQGHLDSALFELQLAQQVDPFSPLVSLNRGRVEFLKRDSARAFKAFHSALELDPQLEVAPLPMAEAYLQSSMFEEAAKALQESTDPTEDEARLAILGSVYGSSGRPEQARQVLRQLQEVARHQPVSGFYFSQIYLALGETETALDWLEKAADERSPLVVYVNVAPQFDRLRSQPRFHALLKRMALER